MDGLGSRGIELRRAEPDDADLIRRTLALAADWQRSHDPGSIEALPGAYHQDWGGPDDIGVLAFDGMHFVAGAYARRVDPADGTYGFVAADLLELTIGVEANHQGRGLGRLVLETLKARVLESGRPGLSLSVSLDNERARRLYAAANFAVAEDRDGDVLMTWRTRSV